MNHESHDRKLNHNILKYGKNGHIRNIYGTMGAFPKKHAQQNGRIRAESFGKIATFDKIVRLFPQSHR